MDFNFFQWIREGVKKSVLLGVSDAVTQMGMPHDEEQVKENLLSFLQDENEKATGRRRLSTSSTAGSTGQRKLGRSLTDIHPAG